MFFLALLLSFGSAINAVPAPRVFNMGALIETFDSMSPSNEAAGFSFGVKDANELILAQHNISINLETSTTQLNDVFGATKTVLSCANCGALFGAFGPQSCATMASAAVHWGIPLLTSGCLQSDFLNREKYPTLVQFEQGSRSQVLGAHLVALKCRHLQLILSSDENLEEIVARLKILNITVSAVNIFSPAAEVTVKRTVVQNARANGFRYIFVFASVPDTRDILIEMDAAGMRTGYFLGLSKFSAEKMFDPTDTPERNEAAARGLEGAFWFKSYIEDSESFRKYLVRLNETRCSTADGCLTNTDTASPCRNPALIPSVRNYDSVMAFATYLAVAMNGTEPSSDPNRFGLQAMKLLLKGGYNGVSGRIRFMNGQGLTSVMLLNRQNGKNVGVGNWTTLQGTKLDLAAMIYPGGTKTPPPEWGFSRTLRPFEVRSWWSDSNIAAVVVPSAVVLVFLIAAIIYFSRRARIARHHNRKLEQERLAEAAVAAERERDLALESNQNKRKFLRYMMHELRVPFHVLDVGLQSLREEKAVLPEDTQVLVCQMTEASNMMLGLMNDALDLQRIEDGRFEAYCKEFDPIKMLRYVIDAHSLRTRDQHIAITLVDDSDRAGAFNVVSDEIRLRQCVSNLVDNAIKFSPDGGRIDVSFNHDGRVATIKVRDQGPGVSLSDRSKLFQAWSQINAGELQKGQGSGLGLSLVKTIIAILDGKVSMDGDETERGACFVLSFPCERVERLAEPESDSIDSVAAARSDSALCGLRVLIVDDSAMIRTVMGRLLSQKEAVVTAAENGLEACKIVEMNEETRFDLVLMDKEMPVMDGHEACRRISSTVPVFGLTGNALEDDVAAFKSCGAITVLVKPMRIESLIEAVVKYNIKSQASPLRVDTPSPGPSRPASPKRPSPTAGGRFLSGLKVLVVDDVAMVRRVTTQLLTKQGATVMTTENGLEACEMVLSEIARGSPFDIVLMDKNMPVCDGYEASEKLRNVVPIFGVTANVLPEDVEEYKTHGVLEVLPKPLKLDCLCDAINRHQIFARSPPLDLPSPATIDAEWTSAAFVLDLTQDMF